MSKRSLKFWDFMAKRYSRKPIADEAAYQKKLQVTQEYFQPDMMVMEFGCGTGGTALIHAPFVSHILAIDGSKKMLEIAKSKAEAEGIQNVTFELATIDDFEAPEQSIDAVLGLSILHLLKNKEAVITKVFKQLKPGGIFVTSTICAGEMSKFASIVAFFGRPFGLILKIFTASELKASITNAGFEIDYEWRPGKDKAVFVVAKKPQQ